VAVPLEVRSDRLCLRRLTAAHVADLVELDSDPEVMRYISGGQPNSRQRYEDELLPRMLAWDEQPSGFLAAYEADRFVGWFHLRPSVADESMLEVGYRLRRAAWGRGLATEGTRALLGHAFERLDQPAVDACADPRNAASIHVMVKCGMQRVGTFMHPRVPLEVVRYMIERDAWPPRVDARA
jgi:RimJ/RimL family protein N-acetyltransferase